MTLTLCSAFVVKIFSNGLFDLIRILIEERGSAIYLKAIVHSAYSIYT